MTFTSRFKYLNVYLIFSFLLTIFLQCREDERNGKNFFFCCFLHGPFSFIDFSEYLYLLISLLHVMLSIYLDFIFPLLNESLLCSLHSVKIPSLICCVVLVLLHCLHFSHIFWCSRRLQIHGSLCAFLRMLRMYCIEFDVCLSIEFIFSCVENWTIRTRFHLLFFIFVVYLSVSLRRCTHFFSLSQHLVRHFCHW